LLWIRVRFLPVSFLLRIVENQTLTQSFNHVFQARYFSHIIRAFGFFFFLVFSRGGCFARLGFWSNEKLKLSCGCLFSGGKAKPLKAPKSEKKEYDEVLFSIISLSIWLETVHFFNFFPLLCKELKDWNLNKLIFIKSLSWVLSFTFLTGKYARFYLINFDSYSLWVYDMEIYLGFKENPNWNWSSYVLSF